MRYLQKQLEEHKGKIVWLASYPKSGNTWFRCFLSALFTGEVNLDKLKSDGIFSARDLFDIVTGIDSRLLLDSEVHNMIPHVFIDRANYGQQLLFYKAHDAYIYNELGNPIFPTEVTHKVIYLVRNPLDIVGSLANHNATTIEKTLELMNHSEGYLAGFTEGLNVNSQFRQLMFSWSKHVLSWINQKNIDVTVVRYEDMLEKPIDTFTNVVDSLEIRASKTAIKNAIRLSSFKQLSSKEEKLGFKEKNIKSEKFFRSGKKGTYLNELNLEQIEFIKSSHKDVMTLLNYI